MQKLTLDEREDGTPLSVVVDIIEADYVNHGDLHGLKVYLQPRKEDPEYAIVAHIVMESDNDFADFFHLVYIISVPSRDCDPQKILQTVSLERTLPVVAYWYELSWETE